MTNRYEDALNCFTRIISISESVMDGRGIFGRCFQSKDTRQLVFLEDDHFEAIKSALQLAQETEQLRLKLSETAIHLAARNSEIGQLRKEAKRLVRENEVFAERHKAWESCVYTVGLPVMRAIRDTEYGDAVPPVPVVNKVTDLLDECNKLRKERDEFKELYDVMVERYTDLAKKVVGE